MLGKTLKKYQNLNYIGVYEWEEHNPWFGDKCAQLSGSRLNAVVTGSKPNQFR